MQTLKLDSSYRPVEVIDAFDAFSMVWMNRAEMIESYDGTVFKSTHDEWEVPCVIVIKRYVSIRRSALTCNRENVLWRDRYTCQYCGKYFSKNKLTLDHVTPKCKGGPKTWENIVTSCIECNQKKGNKLPREAGMVPLILPREPKFELFHAIGKNDIHHKWMKYLKGYPFTNRL